MRGLKENERRPDVIGDDLQDEDDVSTAFRRQKLMRRFRSTIMPLISREGDLYVEGNLMHDDSVLANLLRDPEWDGKLYRALNTELPNEEGYPIGNTKTDGEPLWPDGWSKEALVKKSKEALVKKRRDIKDREFDLEYLNKSRSEEDSLFVTSRFQRFRSSQIDFNRGMRVIPILGSF